MTSHDLTVNPGSIPQAAVHHAGQYNPEPLLHPGMNLSALTWLLVLGLPVLLLFLIYARS